MYQEKQLYLPQPDQSEQPKLAENLPTPEHGGLYVLKGRVIVAGGPGVGKSKMFEEMRKMYDLDDNQVLKVGDVLRSAHFQNTGEQPTGFIDRPLDKDRELDDLQRELLADPDSSHTFLLESRLGGYHVWKLRQSGLITPQHPPIKTILFTVSQKKRDERVYRRDKKVKPSLTLEQSVSETAQREKRDLAQFRQIFSDLEGIDPVSPEAGFMYDAVIDTSNLTVKEQTRYVHLLLLADGIVERARPLRKLEPTGQIFPAN